MYGEYARPRPRRSYNGGKSTASSSSSSSSSSSFDGSSRLKTSRTQQLASQISFLQLLGGIAILGVVATIATFTALHIDQSNAIDSVSSRIALSVPNTGDLLIPAEYRLVLDGDFIFQGTNVSDPEELRGPRGINGTRGPQGATGPQGEQGVQGSAGDRGLRGFQGEAGVNGTAGPEGMVGPAGAQGAEGPLGPTGPQGADGYSCWDTNMNHVCDLGTEDKNNDTQCDTDDCQGQRGPAGNLGPAGEMGVQGPQGPTGAQGVDGYSCWDLNMNHECDLGAEDKNNDTLCDTDDCEGPRGFTGPAGPAGEMGVQGPAGPTGPQGADGYSCWDTNMNHVCDLPTEDKNNDTLCDTDDCEGPRGFTGPQGPAGEMGVQGPAGSTGAQGVDGYSCWDTNMNHECDLLSEDKNNDTLCDTDDCEGPRGFTGPAGPSGADGTQGPAGPTGPQGVDGYSCWDTNMNHECDLLTEDKNNDTQCDTDDCQGQRGLTGPQGPSGADGVQGPTGATGAQGVSGLACWDLNGNRACDLGSEDVNADSQCTVADCRGAQGDVGPAGSSGAQGVQGPTGPTGPQGNDGVSCWDLNQNRVCDLGTEDRNNDTQCNAQDCQGDKGDVGPAGPAGQDGVQGPQGNTGPQGVDGYSCWDLNMNHVCDLGTEDTDSNAQCDTNDCAGPQGPAGATGAVGPQGAVGPTGAQGDRFCP